MSQQDAAIRIKSLINSVKRNKSHQYFVEASNPDMPSRSFDIWRKTQSTNGKDKYKRIAVFDSLLHLKQALVKVVAELEQKELVQKGVDFKIWFNCLSFQSEVRWLTTEERKEIANTIFLKFSDFSGLDSIRFAYPDERTVSLSVAEVYHAENQTDIKMIPPSFSDNAKEIIEAFDAARAELEDTLKPHFMTVFHCISNTYYQSNAVLEEAYRTWGDDVFKFELLPIKRHEEIAAFLINHYYISPQTAQGVKQAVINNFDGARTRLAFRPTLQFNKDGTIHPIRLELFRNTAKQIAPRDIDSRLGNKDIADTIAEIQIFENNYFLSLIPEYAGFIINLVMSRYPDSHWALFERLTAYFGRAIRVLLKDKSDNQAGFREKLLKEEDISRLLEPYSKAPFKPEEVANPVRMMILMCSNSVLEKNAIKPLLKKLSAKEIGEVLLLKSDAQAAIQETELTPYDLLEYCRDELKPDIMSLF